MKPTPVIFLLIGLPESFLLILTALTLVGVRPGLWRQLTASVAFGAVGYVTRYFLASSGWHVPVMIVALIATLTVGFRLALRSAVMAGATSFLVLILGNSFVLVAAMRLWGVTSRTLLYDFQVQLWLAPLMWIPLVLTALTCKLVGARLRTRGEDHHRRSGLNDLPGRAEPKPPEMFHWHHRR